jgi:hypothetical protein
VSGFPDPNGQGALSGQSSPGAGGLDPNSPVFQAAQQACQKLLPAGSVGQPQAQQAQDLKFARCMRAHGISNFPDPATGGSGAGVKLPPDIDASSPQFVAAQKACQSILAGPGGGSAPVGGSS